MPDDIDGESQSWAKGLTTAEREHAIKEWDTLVGILISEWALAQDDAGATATLSRYARCWNCRNTVVGIPSHVVDSEDCVCPLCAGPRLRAARKRARQTYSMQDVAAAVADLKPRARAWFEKCLIDHTPHLDEDGRPR